MKNIEIVSKILAFGKRQCENEQKTARFIKSLLKSNKIDFLVQKFDALVPKIKKAILEIDGNFIPCEGTGLVSGKISALKLLNSLESSQLYLYEPNINFNPKCPTISRSNFYFAPSLAISRQDKLKVINGRNIDAELKVILKKYISENLLVGNYKNPTNILFAHYDSLSTGATDNASGVAVMLNLLLENPQLLKQSLFVFCGNEELSYDQPIYWGHGYRVFEKKYLDLLFQTKKIFVVDCVGNGKTKIYSDPRILRNAFPIKNAQKLCQKIYIVDGDIDELMKVYHSDEDDIGRLYERYLVDAADFLTSRLN